jgi:hypothetical protein
MLHKSEVTDSQYIFYRKMGICMYLWHQADVNIGKVGRATPKLKLPESLDERHPLNVTNGTTKLGRDEKHKKISDQYVTISILYISLPLH